MYSEVAGLKKMLGSVAEQTALALGDLSKKVSTLAQVLLHTTLRNMRTILCSHYTTRIMVFYITTIHVYYTHIYILPKFSPPALSSIPSLPLFSPPAQTQKARCKDCQERGGGGAAAAAVEGKKQEQLAAVKRRALTRVVAKRTRFH